ncbi:MAG: orotidine-5'-phosphate decarboxylase [Chlamydiales bacterium]|jgi:orotidine-5'-phosphate decarboxylase
MSLEVLTPSFTERAQLCGNPTAKALLLLMDEKRSNLSVAADVTTKAELIHLADCLGPEICVLKTHIDIVEDFDQDLVKTLQALAEKHRFLIFEDRKFADIGNTVKAQYEKGMYRIVDWADITNAHTVPGPGIIEGLREVGLPKGRGLLLLAEMSPKGTLAKEEYTSASLRMARQYSDFVIGFISRKKLLDDPRFIHFTPGVSLSDKGDSLGQQYLTPYKVIAEEQSDIIIVGRGIIAHEDPVGIAAEYRRQAWDAYQKKIG